MYFFLVALSSHSTLLLPLPPLLNQSSKTIHLFIPDTVDNNYCQKIRHATLPSVGGLQSYWLTYWTAEKSQLNKTSS